MILQSRVPKVFLRLAQSCISSLLSSPCRTSVLWLPRVGRLANVCFYSSTRLQKLIPAVGALLCFGVTTAFCVATRFGNSPVILGYLRKEHLQNLVSHPRTVSYGPSPPAPERGRRGVGSEDRPQQWKPPLRCVACAARRSRSDCAAGARGGRWVALRQLRDAAELVAQPSGRGGPGGRGRGW